MGWLPVSLICVQLGPDCINSPNSGFVSPRVEMYNIAWLDHLPLPQSTPESGHLLHFHHAIGVSSYRVYRVQISKINMRQVLMDDKKGDSDQEQVAWEQLKAQKRKLCHTAMHYRLSSSLIRQEPLIPSSAVSNLV